MVIRIEDKEYRLKTLEEVTLGDWRKVCSIDANEVEPVRAAIKALTGIPLKKLRLVRASDMTKLMHAAADLIDKAKEARESTDTPTSFDLHGITYVVPEDIEQDALWGQYEDLEKVLIPKCDNEADLCAAIVGVMCLPEGETYKAETVMARVKAMDDLQLLTALRIASFFFDKSETFRSAISHCTQLYLALKLRKAGQMPAH